MIDAVRFTAKSGEQSTWYGGDGGGLTIVTCPVGYIVTGIYGQIADKSVITIGLHCRRSAV